MITRSLRLALPDLLHFALVAGAVFVGYSMMAFVIFGNSVPQFSTFGSAVNACFGMMLGDFGDVFAQLKQLTGVQVGTNRFCIDENVLCCPVHACTCGGQSGDTPRILATQRC